jgi:Serine carboxypeptidase S28
MSYSAIMVAWFMQRHPTLANGAWSSSAPLKATVDFPEYREVVGLAIQTIAGQSCHDRIERAFIQIQDAMTASQFAMLDTEFNTCTSLDGSSEFDKFMFLDSISHYLSGYVQDNFGTEILDACAEIMNSEITNDLSAYAAFARKQLGGYCLAYNYEGFVDFVGSTSWESDVAIFSCKTLGYWCIQSNFEVLFCPGRQWIYQTCNEFGFFTTLNSANQPFGQYDYVHLFTQHCNDAYPGL